MKGLISEIKVPFFLNINIYGTWAFSAVATMSRVECHLVTGNLITLSEQELVDCEAARRYKCCSGFRILPARRSVSNDTDVDYPYIGLQLTVMDVL